VASLLRQAPARSSGKARVGRRSASTARSRGLALRRVRSVERTLLCRFKRVASGRPSCTLRARGASAAGGSRRGDRKRHVGGAGLCTRRSRWALLRAVATGSCWSSWRYDHVAGGSNIGRPINKGCCVQSWTRRLAALEPVDLSTQAASGGSGADVETRRARMPPSLPRRLQATLGPDLPRVGPCSGFRRGPFRTVPESGLDADLCRGAFRP
jgi:hypothetical protein